MRKIMLLAMMLFLVLNVSKHYGQNVKMFYLDTTSYPYFKAGFKIYDAQGNEMRNSATFEPIKKTDVIVEEYENGVKVQREIVGEIECPPENLTAASFVFSIDISHSMSQEIIGGGSAMDAVKDCLKDWANWTYSQIGETAITAFCADAKASRINADEPISTFTSDKHKLFKAIDSMPNICAGTNYNAAFLHTRYDSTVKHYSALHWCKPENAKYKPIIIFITDGNHLTDYGGSFYDGEFNIGGVQLLAMQYNATVYVIQMSTEFITPKNLQHLKDLSIIGRDTQTDTTPNLWLDVNSKEELRDILYLILVEARTIGSQLPCTVKWKTGCDADSGTITFPNHGYVSGTNNYTISPNIKPNLILSSNTINFFNTNLHKSEINEITLKAKNNDVEIENLEFIEDVYGSDRIQIDWGWKGNPPIVIYNGDSYKIAVQYNAVDCNVSYAKMKFIGSFCNEEIITFNASPKISYLDINNEIINFDSTKLFSNSYYDINITAKNDSTSITGIEFVEDVHGSDRIQINDGWKGYPPIVINNGSSYNFRIKYSAIDTNKTYAKIRFLNNMCKEDTITITAIPVVPTISVEDLTVVEKEDFRIIPNPADGYFELLLPKESVGNIQIAIYDLMGTEVMNFKFNDIKSKVNYDVTNLSSGYYFVVCTTDKTRKFKPLIVNH